MNPAILLSLCVLLVQAATAAKPAQEVHWNWHDAQALRVSDSLRNAKIGASEKSAIATVLKAQIRPYLTDLGDDSASRLEEETFSTRVKMIDLNQDGTPEVIAQAMVACGASGNCPFWVLRKQSAGYKLLLDDSAETFTIQKTRTNGYADLVLALHDSAFEQTLDVYRYSDGKYADGGCYVATVAVLEEGIGIRRFSDPQLKPCEQK